MVAIIIGGFLWVVSILSRPDVIATVDLSKTSVTITNHNSTAWRNAEIILNGGIDAPVYRVLGLWPPNERKELSLINFKTRINKQDFKPDVQPVTEVQINASGFGIGTYRTRQ